jgi:hypothetical protein
MQLVAEQEGQKIGIGVTRPISGRTNTAANNRRQPTDPTDTGELDTYRCEKTDFDWAIPYAKLDAWRHRPEFETILRDAILKQQGRDTIMTGWHGTSVARRPTARPTPASGRQQGLAAQDPHRRPGPLAGRWRAHPDATQAIYVASGVELFNQDANTGAGNADTAKADYVNLDALVIDAVELLDEWQRDSTDLVVIVGRDLVHDKYFPMINTAADKAMEIEARDRILRSEKQIGGLPAVRVPFFPARALLITSLDNLAIYEQEETRRRQLKEESEYNRVANYESANVAYVVEDYGKAALVENIVLAPSLPDVPDQGGALRPLSLPGAGLLPTRGAAPGRVYPAAEEPHVACPPPPRNPPRQRPVPPPGSRARAGPAPAPPCRRHAHPARWRANMRCCSRPSGRIWPACARSSRSSARSRPRAA